MTRNWSPPPQASIGLLIVIRLQLSIRHDYLAYFGRYEIDTDMQVVRHFVEGQLVPGDHPAVLERKYRFDGDLMSLRPLDRTNQEILWRRVR